MIEHKHTYDKDGKQICCTQAEKIYTNAGAKELLKENKATGTEQSRSIPIDSTFKLFIPSTISLVILLLAILFDNYYPQEWFTGWIRILWYTASYAPVGFPVIKEAFESFAKKEIFSEFLLMSIATLGAFSIGEYPEGVAVMT